MIDDELAQLLAPAAPDRAAWCCFDAAWYVAAYPRAREALGADASEAQVRDHYVLHGRGLAHAPNMFFDERWYLARYPDAAAAVQAQQFGSGYEHYCAIGYLNRSPHWLYDEATYMAQSPDLTDERLLEADCVNLYDHYIKSGAREGRQAHLMFQPDYYRGVAPDPAAVERMGGFAHFLHAAWFERQEADASPYFDRFWFADRYPEMRAAVAAGQWSCMLHAYLDPAGPTLDPNGFFAEAAYLEAHADAREAVARGEALNGYDHYLKSGVFSLRAPSPEVDLAGFVDRRPGLVGDIARGRVRDAFVMFLRASPEDQRGPAEAPAVDAPPPPPAPIAPAQPAAGYGHIEFYGHQLAAHGWFLCGWISPMPPVHSGEVQIIARFELGQLQAVNLFATFHRPDVAGFGTGVIVYIPEQGAPLGRLVSMTLTLEGETATHTWSLSPTEGAQQYSDQVTAANIIPALQQLPPGPVRGRLLAMAQRPGFTGANTLAQLRDRVFLEIDETIICPRHGIALVGWGLWEPGSVARISLQSGYFATTINFDDAVRLDRADVRDTVGAQHGFSELASGFIVFLPHAFMPDEVTYLEVETARGEFAYRGLPAPKLRGMAAIRFLLDSAELRYNDVARAFDRVFGPAVALLNNDRLRAAARFSEITFGTPPTAPVLSVIVALYGRLDFMEYQLAFASRHQPAIDVEYLYVLDDPGKKREAETLAASLYQRFGIALRLVELERNMGFAPTNNVGLELARGSYVCFLNSDVFAGTDDWMERMVARLEADPGIGAVGPLLLYEDECVQHQGMSYERIPLFADWHFPMHPRKGWRTPDGEGLVTRTAITGACMVMRRAVALEFGGFDESYIIGDFEDSDLCLKLRERGLRCAVDLNVRLYHLERQSQAGTQHRWRMNLTVYNAWVHERRWQDTLLRIAAAEVLR
jgi:GT2 family glycosyltransferase